MTSIVTKKGDDGTTGLLIGGRVSKAHPRIQAVGAVDELNAHLGMCKVATKTAIDIWGAGALFNDITDIQLTLVQIMAELAVAGDCERWASMSEKALTQDKIDGLESIIKGHEVHQPSFKGWATPGTSALSAQFDLATRVCRRAEREVIIMNESGHNSRLLIQQYLNRLSDYLWIYARWAENVS